MSTFSISRDTAVGLGVFVVYSLLHIYISLFDYVFLVICYFPFKFIIYLFTRQQWYLKTIAVLLNWNLLFLFFLPRELKNGIKELKSKQGD
jgi:hypothetical protein